MNEQCGFCNRHIPQQEFLHNEAMTFALSFELAATLIAQFATTSDASAALENEALKLRRRWSMYPVAANGEREYQSWLGINEH